jgi:hypothetical protein
MVGIGSTTNGTSGTRWTGLRKTASDEVIGMCRIPSVDAADNDTPVRSAARRRRRRCTRHSSGRRRRRGQAAVKPSASIGDYCSVLAGTVIIAVAHIRRHTNCGCIKICFVGYCGAGIAIGRYLRCAGSEGDRDAGYCVKHVHAKHQGMRRIMGSQRHYVG